MMEELPGPGTPKPPPNLENVLAQRANDAMAQGADPKAATDLLGKMVAHLRSNPEFAKQGQNALLQGATPEDVSKIVWQHASGGGESQPAKPQGGFLSRVADTVGGAIKQTIMHPLDTAESLISAPIKSAGTAFVAPGVGEARHSAALSKGGNSSGRPIDTSPYDAEHGGVTPRERNVAGVQTAANILLPGIARGVSGKLGGGLLAKIGGSAAAGGTANAAYTPDDPGVGFLSGAILGGAAHGAVKAGGAVAGVASDAAGAVGSKALDLKGRPLESRVIRAGPVELGKVTGLRDMAGDAVARRAAMDAEAGHQPQPMHRSVPPMALDAAGPNVEGLAEGIANRPGPGRSTIVGAVEGRQKLMRPAITSELESGTGVPASARMSLQQDAINARSAEARQNYDAARAETKGQAVTSPSFEQAKASPAGAVAYKAAMGRQGNLFRELPTEVAAPAGFSPEQWKVAQQHMADRGMTIPSVEGGEALPDPETVHFMVQHLRKMTKMGDPSDPVTADAYHVLSVLDKVRDELPESWRKSNDAYAARSRIIDMGDTGRNVYRTRINPPTRGQKGVNVSLDGLNAKKVIAAPDEQAALQRGAAVAAHARLQSAPGTIKAPGRIFGGSSERVEQTSHAFPSPDKAADFQHAVQSWDRVQEQSQRLTGNSRTGLRGAEGSGKGELSPSSLLSGARAIAHKIVAKVGGEAQAEHQQRLEGEIAKILAGTDLPQPGATPSRPPSRLLEAAGVAIPPRLVVGQRERQ